MTSTSIGAVGQVPAQVAWVGAGAGSSVSKNKPYYCFRNYTLMMALWQVARFENEQDSKNAPSTTKMAPIKKGYEEVTELGQSVRDYIEEVVNSGTAVCKLVLGKLLFMTQVSRGTFEVDWRQFNVVHGKGALERAIQLDQINFKIRAQEILISGSRELAEQKGMYAICKTVYKEGYYVAESRTVGIAEYEKEKQTGLIAELTKLELERLALLNPSGAKPA